MRSTVFTSLWYPLCVFIAYAVVFALILLWDWLTTPTREELRNRRNVVRFLLGWGERRQPARWDFARRTPAEILRDLERDGILRVKR